jgi:transglutaminase-like putative cysteine protease
MLRSLTSLLPIVLVLCPAARAPAGERVYFSVSAGDRLIGYAELETEPVKRDGRDYLLLKSRTVLKVALLGKPHNVLLESETLLAPDTGRPVRYHATDTTNDVVQQTECELGDGVARTWSFRKGDPKGEPRETKLAEGTLLFAANNFGHLERLAQAAAGAAADGRARRAVFIPEAQAAQTFELVRGEDKEVSVRGAPRPCVCWRMAKENLSLLLDARTRQLVRVEAPGQQTVIALAGPTVAKQVHEARAEEALAKHFTASNQTFDDYLKVTALTAEIDVELIGSGVDNDVACLKTAMQTFDGKKEQARLTGKVAVRTRPYDGKDSPPFPQKADGGTDPWLKPEAYIESDHPSIVGLAAELTKGAATRWEATLRVGQWVHREIAYTIGDTPSARLALEKKKGDCGPHATLTVALLRAAGIPARLVGGLLYTPTFGGTFGQHAWVEAHLGPAGWVAFDPTTGEFGRLCATHIKLFEGMGGVIPQLVRVVAFEPPNRAVTASAPVEVRPLPWKPGRTYTYRYVQDGQEIGRETFVLTQTKHDGKDAFQVKSDLDLKAGGVAVKGAATLVVTPAALPLSYRRDLEAAGQKYTFDCAFRDGTVEAKVCGAKELSREIKLPAGCYFFDNNLMASWALLCSQPALQAGKSVELRAFSPSALQTLTVTLEPAAPGPVTVAGREVECFPCEVPVIKNTFWITRDGRLLKVGQGKLAVELTDAND